MQDNVDGWSKAVSAENANGASPQAYCLNCFALVPAERETCPRCEERAALLSARGYKEKLLHALFHPLAEVRMRAIIALGLRADGDTAPALVECALRHATDLVQGLEIVNSLSRLQAGGPCVPALHDLASRHPARAVKQAALWASRGI